jgi:hypothetical protein
VQEAYRTPNNQDQKLTIPRYIIIKREHTEQRKILKAAKEKRQVTYKSKPIRIATDYSSQTLNARRSWKDIIQELKESNFQSRLLYQAKLSS